MAGIPRPASSAICKAGMLYILAILSFVNAGQLKTVEIPAPVIKVLAPPRIRYEIAEPQIINVEPEIRYVTPPTIQLRPNIIRIQEKPVKYRVRPVDVDAEVDYGRGVGTSRRRFSQRRTTVRRRVNKSRGKHSRVRQHKVKSKSHERSRISGDITISHSSKVDVEVGTGSLTFDVWLVFERRHYMVKRNAKSFNDAERSCRKHHAHLVSIHSEAENNFIHKITADGSRIRSFFDFVYIGLHQNSRNKWEWTDGSAFNYNKWAVHQPDKPKTEKCAQFHQGPARLVYVQDYHWNSISCERPMRYYVCKK
ncbi:unnamed protein product [Cylicocyclus nassatus]|uniref:C-type lectin domain-containing protein n=1 Tax=Cylicocyclus nassatus TaxID=53992 RepID=A0AA36M7V9_CYLNA|nr:unnamed protein product [Cylicocyclus nassatus]